MDAIVEGLLIAGLHSLDNDDLPMQTNEFYSKVVLACKPAGAASLLLCICLALVSGGMITQVRICYFAEVPQIAVGGAPTVLGLNLLHVTFGKTGIQQCEILDVPAPLPPIPPLSPCPPLPCPPSPTSRRMATTCAASLLMSLFKLRGKLLLTGATVDIKKSTYKNLAKLLKAFEKKVRHPCAACSVGFTAASAYQSPHRMSEALQGYFASWPLDLSASVPLSCQFAVCTSSVVGQDAQNQQSGVRMLTAFDQHDCMCSHCFHKCRIAHACCSLQRVTQLQEHHGPSGALPFPHSSFGSSKVSQKW